ncbi:MAG: hydrogenase maturation protease [Gallionella sp.]|nr:hydrogenase maturation protease [Gallionella sp.]MDD4947568.1 hydrogenase maturation protease [Gallionella sp.]
MTAATPAHPLPSQTLVFAIGNESRGDDALGPLLLRGLQDWLNDTPLAPQVELLEDFQLQIEHALDLQGRQRVLFVDAGMDTEAPFAFYRIESSAEPVLYSHALAPTAVLQAYRQFYREEPPASYVLCIRGQSFELGEPLSPEAQSHLAAALDFARKLLNDTANWPEHCDTARLASPQTASPGA